MDACFRMSCCFPCRCPRYPPLPQYCTMVNVPGQCCPSMQCKIPDAGTYRPTPQLEPGLIPTSSVNQTNPQLIIPGLLGPLTGGMNPPGGGTIVPNGYIGGVTGECT